MKRNVLFVVIPLVIVLTVAACSSPAPSASQAGQSMPELTAGDWVKIVGRGYYNPDCVTGTLEWDKYGACDLWVPKKGVGQITPNNDRTPPNHPWMENGILRVCTEYNLIDGVGGCGWYPKSALERTEKPQEINVTPVPLPTFHPDPTKHVQKPCVMVTVSRGQTITSIANAQGADPGEVMVSNGIADPTKLQIGTQLRVCPK